MAFQLSLSSVTVFSYADEPVIQKPPLVLGQGEQRFMHVPGMIRYTLGKPIIRILSPKHDPSHSKEGLLMKGVEIGVTDLWIWRIWKENQMTEYRTIRVEKWSHDKIHKGLEKALGELNEAEIIFSGKGIVLRGEIQSLQELKKITSIAHDFPKEIHDETEPDSFLIHDAQEKIKQWIAVSPFQKNLRVERIARTLWIRGHIDQPTESHWVKKKLELIFPNLQFEINTFPHSASTVYFRVFLFELKRSRFKSFGLSWPSSVAHAFQVTTGSIHNLLSMDLMLQQMEGKGQAKILSNPELVVRAPGEAELFAGGEFAIQTKSRFHSNVTWKKYGLTLKLKVTHLVGDRIRLEIFTEVSHIDSKIAQDSIPGIQSNWMKTQVDANFEEPLFLSGLLQEGIRSEVKGLPFLKKLPILGALFGSDDYLNERSELIAILYPHASPPQKTISQTPRITPQGTLPPPRDWLTIEEERFFELSENYPWNLLEK